MNVMIACDQPPERESVCVCVHREGGEGYILENVLKLPGWFVFAARAIKRHGRFGGEGFVSQTPMFLSYMLMKSFGSISRKSVASS
jgi:hypothetical protein